LSNNRNKTYEVILLLLVAGFSNCFSQTDSVSVQTEYRNIIPWFMPNMTSTHPLGIFTSRINHNFQTEPGKKVSLAFNISNGNVWLPYVKGYLPQDEADIVAMKELEWYDREYYYDTVNSPSKTMELHADGIVRLYQLKLSFPVSKRLELGINMRAFSVDPGNIPFSTLTSDQFIEWFHSNIYGGEDPFARKAYGLNLTKFSYTDQNGSTFHLNNGDFIFSGIELSGYYYPHIKSLINRNIFLNVGLLTGFNTSTTNPSLDVGLNSSLNKQIKTGNRSKLQLGISGGVLRQKLLTFGEGVQISDKKFLFTTEFLLDYQMKTKRGGLVSIGTTYFIQGSYFERGDFESMVLTGDRISTHWHYALSHLYRKLTYNTLFVSCSKGHFSFSAYLKEDLFVDNAPDVQTGAGIKVIF
jgi:hypothetical protein